MRDAERVLLLAEVASATGGAVRGDPRVGIRGIAVHSAAVGPGDLFVALRGRRADGHDFVPEAAARGAAAALVGRPVEARIPQVLVPDTARALLPLAALYRSRFRVQAIGVTGSVGKTTTVQLIGAVLSSAYPVHVSAPEWNAELGVPLTLFGLRAAHRFLVVELAMRGLGQIRALCEAVRPEIGVVTNVGSAHLERLGSVENIARAKAELVEALPEHGWAVLHADDPRVRAMGSRTRARVVFYGTERGEVRAEEVRVEAGAVRFVLCTPQGRLPARLPIPGRHLVSNALAAAAVGWVCGVPLEAVGEVLSTFQPPRFRLEVREVARAPSPSGPRSRPHGCSGPGAGWWRCWGRCGSWGRCGRLRTGRRGGGASRRGWISWWRWARVGPSSPGAPVRRGCRRSASCRWRMRRRPRGVSENGSGPGTRCSSRPPGPWDWSGWRRS